MCLYEHEDVDRLEVQRQLLLEEEKAAIENAEIAYDLMDAQEREQAQILAQTLREIGEQDIVVFEDDVEEQPSLFKDNRPAPYEYRDGVVLKSYSTGEHPSMEDVIKENKRPSYPYYGGGYGVWGADGRREEGGRPWANRFDDDDGVCRDPYSYYSGDWY